MTDETTGAVTAGDVAWLRRQAQGTRDGAGNWPEMQNFADRLTRLLAAVERERQRQDTPDVAAAREAVHAAVRSFDREIDRMQGEDGERVIMPLVDALITAARALGRAEAGALTREQEDAVIRRRAELATDARGYVRLRSYTGREGVWEWEAIVVALGVTPAREGA